MGTPLAPRSHESQDGPRSLIEHRQYGYHPTGYRDAWVILATVPGARGPFTETRIVTYGPWRSDEQK